MRVGLAICYRWRWRASERVARVVVVGGGWRTAGRRGWEDRRYRKPSTLPHVAGRCMSRRSMGGRVKCGICSLTWPTVEDQEDGRLPNINADATNGSASMDGYGGTLGVAEAAGQTGGAQASPFRRVRERRGRVRIVCRRCWQLQRRQPMCCKLRWLRRKLTASGCRCRSPGPCSSSVAGLAAAAAADRGTKSIATDRAQAG